MGCDIHGRVEVDHWSKFDDEGDSWWCVASHLHPFVGRRYDAFGCLFGVRNNAGFEPIAADRGIPGDAARKTREAYESWGRDAHSASYFTYAELQNIDWSKPAKQLDGRYSVLDENKEPTGTKFGFASGWADVISENREAIDAGEAVPNEAGDKYIQRRRLTREDAIAGDWDWFLNEHLGHLAERFGEGAVRVVVWFDN